MSKLFIKNRFATTPNELLYNPNITLRAKGLFAFIQGKPDGWVFSAERIAFENKEGLHSIRSALKELEHFGFLSRIKRQNEKGYWEVDYILYSEPQNPADEIPTSGNRPTENRTSGKPTSGNHTNNNNTEVKKKDINNKSNISFEDFWDLYDKKVSRDKSEKAWNRLSAKDKELIMQFIPKYKEYQPDKKFRKDPTTFFNNKTWLDELTTSSPNPDIIPGETPEERARRLYVEGMKTNPMKMTY